MLFCLSQTASRGLRRPPSWPRILRGGGARNRPSPPYTLNRTTVQPSRSYSTDHNNLSDDTSRRILDDFKRTLTFPSATCDFQQLVQNGDSWMGTTVRLHGYIGTRRDANRRLSFAMLQDSKLQTMIQIVCSESEGSGTSPSSLATLRGLTEHVPVVVEGTVQSKKASKADSGTVQSSAPAFESGLIRCLEIKVDRITPVNTFPSDIIMKDDTNMPAEQRHLQIRNDKQLRDGLLLRGRTGRFMRQYLAQQFGFEEFETPLLFKSTPEGAREFLVPTRQPGMAYALPQSPQQYKQILMASGISRYMQLARCFRDEDLRADRQPEFTQLDLEMSFATGQDVMHVVEKTIKAVWKEVLGVDSLPPSLPQMTYEEAMSRYGSDKPDVRFGSEIRRVEHLLPVDLVSKIGPLTSPIVETFKLSVSDEIVKTRAFVNDFMASPEARPFLQNAEGQPGIFIFDPSKPLQGLQPFGFEAAEQIEEMLGLKEGDIVVLQARRNSPFSDGATAMGNLRLAMHRAAVSKELIPAPVGFEFLWIVDFPLFTQNIDTSSVGNVSADFTSTHHPFTAPKSAEDVDLLLTAPLEVKADHYDLVVNGVELGGGSRRIHVAEMQELILRSVLGMSDERVADFSHLLDVLKAGCPPHAGMALGFDRMIAVMLGRTSVRDVIAFPKSGRGEDLLVRSPTKMTDAQLETYHLRNV